MENNGNNLRGAYCLLNQFFTLFVGVVLMAVLLGCNENESFRKERRVEGKISFLDVLDARALIIGGTGNLKSDGSSYDQSGNTLFKITEDGVVQEISYWQIDTIYIETEIGMEMEIDSTEMTTTFFPVHLFDADENHLIVCFNEVNPDDPNNYSEYDYLVRKSDGAVFQLPWGYRPQTGWGHYNQMFKNEESSVLIQRDDEGTIYFVGKGDIMKLRVQNPENINIQQITTGGHTGEGVSNYRVNGSGHIIFNTEGISTPAVTRIRFSNGGLAYPEKTIKPFWRGFDNNFYISYTTPYQAGASIFPVVEKVTIENGQVNYQSIGEVNHPSAELTYMINSFIFKMRNINKIVTMEFADHMNVDGKVVAEVYNTENEIKAFAMSELGISQIRIGVSSDNFYYLSGMDQNQPVLLKVDPSVFPHSTQHLVPRGSYDIYNMVVTSDDYVMVYALRMADGNNVIIQISPTGELTVLDDIGTDVIQLIRIS